MATRPEQLAEKIDHDDIFGPCRGLLTVRELAEILAVSEKTVYAWIASGDVGLPYIKLGSAVRFRPAAVRAWLREREFGPTGGRRG